jgi:hypothetical protein
MRIVIECILCLCVISAFYHNLTDIPKQDYIHNNPWKQSVTSGPLIKTENNQ